jgi:hypothetical protein
MPPDFVCCLHFDGFRRSPCMALLLPGRVRPKSSRCISSRTACDFPVYQFDHGVATLYVVALHSSSSSFCCCIRAYSGLVTSLLRTPELRAFLARATSAYSAHLLLARCHATAAALLTRAPLLPRATCSSAANICARSALPRTRSPCTPAPGATHVRAIRSHTSPRARSRRSCTAPAFTSPYFNATRTAPASARSRAPPHLLGRQGLSAPCAHAQRLHCPRTRPIHSCPAPRPPPAPHLSRSCSVHHRAPAREPPRHACLRVLPASPARHLPPPALQLLRRHQRSHEPASTHARTRLVPRAAHLASSASARARWRTAPGSSCPALTPPAPPLAPALLGARQPARLRSPR